MWQFISLRSLACDLLFIKQILTPISFLRFFLRRELFFVKKLFFLHPPPPPHAGKWEWLSAVWSLQRKGKIRNIPPSFPSLFMLPCCHFFSAVNKNGPFLSCDMMQFVSFQAVTCCNLWASKLWRAAICELPSCDVLQFVSFQAVTRCNLWASKLWRAAICELPSCDVLQFVSFYVEPVTVMQFSELDAYMHSKLSNISATTVFEPFILKLNRVLCSINL